MPRRAGRLRRRTPAAGSPASVRRGQGRGGAARVRGGFEMGRQVGRTRRRGREEFVWTTGGGPGLSTAGTGTGEGMTCSTRLGARDDRLDGLHAGGGLGGDLNPPAAGSGVGGTAGSMSPAAVEDRVPVAVRVAVRAGVAGTEFWCGRARCGRGARGRWFGWGVGPRTLPSPTGLCDGGAGDAGRLDRRAGCGRGLVVREPAEGHAVDRPARRAGPLHRRTARGR